MKILNNTIFKFMLVGVINTLFGTAVMFVMYNLFGFNYLISTISNYFFGSILSFFLNKFYTFSNKDKDFKQIVKFTLNIVLCYVIAYWIPVAICNNFINTKEYENVFMSFGVVIFILLNFIGQKYFVFNSTKK